MGQFWSPTSQHRREAVQQGTFSSTHLVNKVHCHVQLFQGLTTLQVLDARDVVKRYVQVLKLLRHVCFGVVSGWIHINIQTAKGILEDPILSR